MDGFRKRSPFLASVREAIPVRHFSFRSDEAYVGWTRRFIDFHRKRHPRDLGEVEVQAFLNHLALRCQVSPSTQSHTLRYFFAPHLLDRDPSCAGISQCSDGLHSRSSIISASCTISVSSRS